MAKTLGPTAAGPGQGLGFWAQRPISATGPSQVSYFPVRITEWGYPIEYPYSVQLRTWIGPKAIFIQSPIGVQLYDLPPKGYEYPVSQRTWLQNLLLSPSRQVTYKPVTITEWGTPPEAGYSIQLRTWVGVKPPQVVGAPFSQDDWPVLTGPQQPRREWVWSYNLSLIGQDSMIVGDQVTDLSPRPYPEPATRTWTVWYNLNLIGKDRMIVGDQFYDRPTLDQLQTVRGWTWNYNLNLIGQDQLPTGETTNIVPKGPEHHVQLRSWLWNYNLNLIGKDQLPIGVIIAERPPLAPSLLQAWISSVNLALTFVAAAPFSQSDWPVNLGPIQPGRGYATFFNPNLAGQDRLPFRQDRWPLTPAPERAISLSTWIDQTKLLLLVPFRQTDWPVPFGPRQPALSYTAFYNPNLIGQDQLPTGEQTYDLSPRPYPEPATRIWAWAYNLNLVAQDRMAVGEQVTDLSPKAPLQLLRSWTWSYNLNLTGQDALPVGEQRFDLPPRPYSPPGLSWLFAYNVYYAPTPPAPFNQQDWPVTPWPRQLQRSWTWSYNLDLIGQDQLTAGKQVTDLVPRGYEYAAFLRSWTVNLQQSTLQPIPYGKPFYERPILSLVELPRSWAWSYNLRLIGQDQLPAGFKVTDLPPQPALSAIQLRTWINAVNLALVTTPAVLPFNQYSWPINIGPQQPISIFTAVYNKNLVGQDKLPTGEIVIDLPPGPYQQPTSIFVASYNKNLIGQDRLPIGRIDTTLPDQQRRQAITWINAVNLALNAPAVRPFVQSDWPINIGPTQPTQVFTASFNKNLIGQDKLPVGEVVTDLPPRGYIYSNDLRTWFSKAQQPEPIILKPGTITEWGTVPPAPYSNEFRSWIVSRNLPLFTPVVPLPHNQYDWLLSGGWTARTIDRYYDRSFVNSSGINLLPPSGITPVPPPTPPDPSTRQPIPGLEWQFYDRMREKNPIGWR